MSTQIYHNPRCSKSRATLALLKEHGIEPEVVEYLKEPPDETSLRALLEKLGLDAIDLVRRKEPICAELDLEGRTSDELIRCMVEHPVLIERPIVVRGNRARIGRPPERVLEILAAAAD